MRIGDVSRARRFANPARLRWYAFHRSVRFALRMLRSSDELDQTVLLEQLPYSGTPIEGPSGMELPDESGSL